MEVAEAINGAAAADRRGVVRRTTVHLHQQQSLNHCKPSADYLFNSAAKLYGAGTLALVMTGMGSDGLAGARYVHEAGGVVLTQDEATSAVWGMPGRVFEAGLSREPLPLDRAGGRVDAASERGTRRARGTRHRRNDNDGAAAEWKRRFRAASRGSPWVALIPITRTFANWCLPSRRT